MTIFLAIGGAYLLLGAVFAVFFAVRGCVALDEGARGGGVFFRMMLIPGAILLWPKLLRLWIGGANA